MTAARSSVDVVLVDEHRELGGSLLSETPAAIDGKHAESWLTEAIAELEAHPNMRVMTRATAIGYYHENMVGVAEKLTDHLAEPLPLHRVNACGAFVRRRSFLRKVPWNVHWCSTEMTAPA